MVIIMCDYPISVDEIRQSVVASVIMSSLSVVTDKSNWAYHLYKIYQQYPDHMLRSVMQKLRAYKMVSIKKHAARSKMPRSTITTASGSTNSGSQGGGANYLPLSSSPYQLSVSFIHKFLSRYRYGGMYFLASLISCLIFPLALLCLNRY